MAEKNRIHPPAENGKIEYTRLYSVKEVCGTLGITRKTLFYYDQIGLLKPTGRVGPQECKVYDAYAVEQLIEILNYRRAGMSIEQVRQMMDADCIHQISILEDVLILLNEKLQEVQNKIELARKLKQQIEERTGMDC